MNGPNPERENSPEYIQEALDAGFDVEVDVWFVDNQWFLGHDEPTYSVKFPFLINDKLWIHCKNIEALDQVGMNLMVSSKLHLPNYFWHDSDDYTLTSQNMIWTYPGKEVPFCGIAVLPEKVPRLGYIRGIWLLQ